MILLVLVGLLAMIYRIGAVLCATILSAVIWDFFFIPPRFTFTVESLDDGLLLAIYVIIAMISAIMTYRIKQFEKKDQQRIQQEDHLKLYNALFNSLSHELQTPITSIIGAVDIIKDNNLSETNKKELITTISDSALRLSAQVSNLLNLSRIESGFLKLRLDWCDLNDLVFSSMRKIENQEEVGRIKVEMEENLPLVRLDQHLIEQVLLNLQNNAILYTPAGSLIEIQVSLQHTLEGELNPETRETPELTENRLKIIVRDHGPGFTEGEQKLIFDKFYRLNKTDHKGTGLGLSIVKGFVEAHLGQIYLGRTAHGGAEFMVNIPVQVTYLNRLKNE